MKKTNPPGKMVRITDYTAMLIHDLTPAVIEYWKEIDRKAGKEPSKLTTSDVIRTGLSFMKSDLERRGLLKVKATGS